MDEYVAKALKIKERNDAEFTEFKKVLQKTETELNEAKEEQGRIMTIVGTEAARDRELLRRKIKSIEDRIKEQSIAEDQFVRVILAATEYVRSKNSLKKLSARDIEILLNELAKYRFTPIISGDGGFGI